MDISSVALIVGPQLLATIISGILFGFATQQTLVYFTNFPSDRKPLRLMVGSVWILDMAHMSFAISCIYEMTVINLGHAERFAVIPTSLSASVFMTSGLLMIIPRRKWLKLGMFLWIGFINITVACVWVPAVLQLSTRWIQVNKIYDRVEKILYLITDAGLNYYFIRTVQRRLVAAGLTKYNKLLRFNKMIVWVSIAMDVMIIGFMFMKNPLVYLMVHPLAFMVKLEIEMAMSKLIVLIALGSGIHVNEFDSDNTSRTSPQNIQSMQVSVSVHHEAIRDFDGDDASLNNDVKPSRDVTRMRSMGHSVPLDSISGADFRV